MGSLLDNARRALERTSASQIEEWVRCPRRWYNAQVLGLRTPPTDAMLRGTAIHAIVEARLLRQPDPANALPDHVKRVESALPHFPAPGKKGLEIEQWIEMPTFEGGPKIVGRYDAIDWEHVPGLSQLFDDFDHGDGVEVVNFDAKTTSDFRYAKTPAELSDNVQMGIYGSHVFEKRPDVDALGLRHVYVRTRGAARSMPVDVVVSRGQAADRHGRTLGLVREMGAAARELPTDAQELPANTASCNAFGGCPYRRLCGLDGPVVEFEKNKIERFTDEAEAVLEKVNATSTPGGWFANSDENANENEKRKDDMTIPNGTDLMEKLRQRSAAKSVGAADPAPSTPAPAPAAAKAPPPAETAPKPPAPAPAPATASTGPIGCPSCAGKRYVKATDPAAPPNSYVACKLCGAVGTVPAAIAEKWKAEQGKMSAAPAPAKLSDAERVKKFDIKYAGTGKISTKEGADSGWIMRDPKDDLERRIVAEGIAAEEAAKADAATGGAQIADETAAPGGAQGFVPPDAPSRVDGVDEAPAPEPKPKKTRAAKPAAAPEPAPNPTVLSSPTLVETGRTSSAEAQTSNPPRVGAERKAGSRIYVDCLPTKGADKALAVSYEEWLAPLMETAAARAVNAKTGLPQPVLDWRLADYGSGEGLLAVAIREALPTLPEVVLVSGISKARGVFLECVVPGAALVVKGI